MHVPISLVALVGRTCCSAQSPRLHTAQETTCYEPFDLVVPSIDMQPPHFRSGARAGSTGNLEACSMSREATESGIPPALDLYEEVPSFLSSLLLSCLELSDAHVYAPETRALLGTAAHLKRSPRRHQPHCRIWLGSDSGSGRGIPEN